MKPLRYLFGALGGAMTLLLSASSALASESDLVLPDLSSVKFLGMPGTTLLTVGLFISLIGLVFGLVIYKQLKGLSVHKGMRDVSELIYETCKTYLFTQGKFILHALGLHRHHHRGVLRRLCSAYAGRRAWRSSCSSAWWASRAATAWPGSASA